MSGAKNCPETPRQKMIAMMYLVLTAMLALNVSADIINGFARLRHSMDSSIQSTEARTTDIVGMFENAYNKDEGSKKKYGDWWVIAQAVQNESNAFYDYIENFKLEMARLVDREEYDKMPADLKNGSDTNGPHQYALNGASPKATALRNRMVEYLDYMTIVESPCIKHKQATDAKFAHDWDLKMDMFRALFNTDDVRDEEGNTLTWENSTFAEMPAAAVIALLTKYQNDVRVAENDMINFLFMQAGSSDFVVNQVTPLVIPENGEYIMQGNKYRAKVVSAMVDTNRLPIFYINGQEYTDGYYEVTASRPGQQSYEGYMLLGDDTTHYYFKGQYTVGVPSATISNKDLNIMYSSYENKFSVSVPGVADNKVKVSATGASIKQEGGLWVVSPSAGSREVKLDVSAEMDGKWQSMGSQLYKVKALPKPSTFISLNGTDYADKVQRSILLNEGSRITASYGPDGLIDLNYKITKFTLILPSGKQMQVNGDKFSKQQLDELKKLKQGAIVNLFYVYAKTPNGNEIQVQNMSVILN